MSLSVPATINQAVAAVTGFTTPSWATTLSNQTVQNGRVYIVTGKAGTQPSAVDVHSASRNFSILVTQPANLRSIPPLNAAGQLVNVPINVYGASTRKGLTSMVGQPSQHGYVKSQFGIPAGADLNDPDNVAAMILSHAMYLAQIAQGIIDTAKSGQS
jgi:hypothetical protein